MNEFPEYLKVCGNCLGFDAEMTPFVVLTQAGDDLECRYCNSQAMIRADGGYTLTESERDACAHFEPTEAARAEAADIRAYQADPHTYNGVSPQDFD